MIIFTHNDLDAISCMLNIHIATNKMPVTFHTNYKNIEEKTYEIIDYIDKHQVSKIYILDISFSQNKHNLISILKKNIPVIFLDHHTYEPGYFESLLNFKNFKYVHDISKSAGLITYEYFHNVNKSKALDVFTSISDTYDLWQVKKPNFDEALQLNNYFWTVGIDWMFNEMINNNYKLPNNFKSTNDKYLIDRKKGLESLYNKKLIRSDGTTSIVFADQWFTEALLSEFDKGSKVVIIANSYGIMRIRFNAQLDIDDKIWKAIKNDILGTENIGHLHAFSLKIEKNGFEEIMEKIQELVSIINMHI